MTTAALKKKIHKVIDEINDNHLLEAVFTLLNKNVTLSSNEYELSEDDIKILEDRKASYKSGKAKMYTVSEVRKKIMKNLGK